MLIDYNRKMKDVLSGLVKRETLLMHACCAVCAGGVLSREFEFAGKKKRLADFFDITLYFYNPNIDTKEEHDKRAGELAKLRGAFLIKDMIITEFEPERFSGLKPGGGEGGARCRSCIEFRLYQTAVYAKRHGFDRFCSTLSVSPHKNAEAVNLAGVDLEKSFGIPFLPADFKKENGFLAANQTAGSLEIYRQNYCGCKFSKNF